MNGAANLMPKFYVIASIILILTGIAQLFVRPRAPNETLLQKVINRSVLTAILSLAFGCLGLLFGLGVIALPHMR
jgi:hypothetical protein